MDGHTCYHCKQWVEPGEPHDCWTTTETALTADLDEDLRDAWERLRDTAAEFGEQRIYASHKSIMFSRRSCYFFVRPKRCFLELNVFLRRAVQATQVRKVVQSSAAKKVHVIHVRHRDEVEAPITAWLQEAYEFAGEPGTGNTTASANTTENAKGTKKKNVKALAGKKRPRRAGRAKTPLAAKSAAKARRRRR